MTITYQRERLFPNNTSVLSDSKFGEHIVYAGTPVDYELLKFVGQRVYYWYLHQEPNTVTDRYRDPATIALGLATVLTDPDFVQELMARGAEVGAELARVLDAGKPKEEPLPGRYGWLQEYGFLDENDLEEFGSEQAEA